jgi:hypothetical protein
LDENKRGKRRGNGKEGKDHEEVDEYFKTMIFEVLSREIFMLPYNISKGREWKHTLK